MTSTPHAVKKGADGSLERPRFDLSGILGQALVSKEGSSTQLGSAENLKGNYVALYFSGHWWYIYPTVLTRFLLNKKQFMQYSPNTLILLALEGYMGSWAKQDARKRSAWFSFTVERQRNGSDSRAKDQGMRLPLHELYPTRLYAWIYRCPPCRQFTPILIQAYYAAKRAGHPLEVVFVSSDRDMESFSVSFHLTSKLSKMCITRPTGKVFLWAIKYANVSVKR